MAPLRIASHHYYTKGIAVSNYPPGVTGVPEDSAHAVERSQILEQMERIIWQMHRALHDLVAAETPEGQNASLMQLCNGLRRLWSAYEALRSGHDMRLRASVIIEHLLTQLDDQLEHL